MFSNQYAPERVLAVFRPPQLYDLQFLDSLQKQSQIVHVCRSPNKMQVDMDPCSQIGFLQEEVQLGLPAKPSSGTPDDSFHLHLQEHSLATNLVLQGGA